MKTFLSILTAGLLLLGIYFYHSRMVSEWEKQAVIESKTIREQLDSADHIPTMFEITAESMLQNAPFGADKSELESALADLRARKQKP